MTYSVRPDPGTILRHSNLCPIRELVVKKLVMKGARRFQVPDYFPSLPLGPHRILLKVVSTVEVTSQLLQTEQAEVDCIEFS